MIQRGRQSHNFHNVASTPSILIMPDFTFTWSCRAPRGILQGVPPPILTLGGIGASFMSKALGTRDFDKSNRVPTYDRLSMWPFLGGDVRLYVSSAGCLLFPNCFSASCFVLASAFPNLVWSVLSVF